MSGHTFEKSAIMEWLARNPKCPLTNAPFDKTRDTLIPNLTLKEWILRKVPESVRKDAEAAVQNLTKELNQVSWQWCMNMGTDTWRDYDMSTQTRLESAHKAGKDMVRINAAYYVDVKASIQVDSSHGSRQRPVRRVTGRKPEAVPCWFYQIDDTKTPQFELANFAPLSLDESQLLELEFQKPENEKNIGLHRTTQSVFG